jgi:protein-tyrosine phosphatase
MTGLDTVDIRKSNMTKQSVLFVCLGNICRSPLAEGIFRHQIETLGLDGRIAADSAGTGGWHEGQAPDPRSIAVAAVNSIDLTALRARQVRQSDFDSFDLILGMDKSNVENLIRIAPERALDRIHLFSALTLGANWDVPDPYYGGAEGFRDVYNMLSEGCASLATRLKSSDISFSGKISSVR